MDINRRDFLQRSLGVTVAGSLVADALAAQSPVPAGIPEAVPVSRRLILDANSRALQWVLIGFGAVCAVAGVAFSRATWVG